MSVLQEVQEQAIKKIKKKIPALKPGYTVAIHQKVKEGEKERIQIFEGLIIQIGSGHGADKTFTVRKVVEGIGVEKIFPLYSPLIEKIQVKKEGLVRRARLYYMRSRFGKSARLRETFVSSSDNPEEIEKSIEELAAQKAEEEAEKAKAEGITPEAQA